MATNQKALELQRQEKVEYDWGTLWPHYHKEKMNWATGFRTKGDVDILFLSGSTGRDPFEDGPCRTPDEERAGKGKVVGGIKEQTRQTLEDIKNSLELMGATLKHIVMFRYFLKRREDVFDMRDEMYKFFGEARARLTSASQTSHINERSGDRSAGHAHRNRSVGRRAEEKINSKSLGLACWRC